MRYIETFEIGGWTFKGISEEIVLWQWEKRAPWRPLPVMWNARTSGYGLPSGLGTVDFRLNISYVGACIWKANLTAWNWRLGRSVTVPQVIGSTASPAISAVILSLSTEHADKVRKGSRAEDSDLLSQLPSIPFLPDFFLQPFIGESPTYFTCPLGKFSA